jgi:hypothetical protein
MNKIKRIMTEPEYRQVDAISYSMLAGVDKTPASLINKEKLESDGITYGSAVDCYLFDGEKVFKEKFCILDDKPTGKAPEIIDDVYILAKNKANDFTPISHNLEDYKEEILATAKAMNFGQTWNESTLLNKILTKEGNAYFVSLIESTNKLVLDVLTYERVVNTCNILRRHEFSCNIFAVEEEVETHFQFAIIWYIRNKKCKSLLDVLKIDHKNKIIYPIDLKTTYDHILGFEKNYIKFRYPIQESFYTDAVHYWKNNIAVHLKDYEVAPFEFVIVQNINFAKPLIYTSTQASYNVGKFGGKYKGKKVKGYLELIGDRDWHLENQKFDYPKEIYDNNGRVRLNVFD